MYKVLLSLLFAVSSHAGVSDYFKPVSKKTIISTLKNIDFIYVINLDQREEKFAHVVRELAPFGIIPHRFSAVNGWELSLEAIDNLGVRLSREMDSGQMGTYYAIPGGEATHERVARMGQTYYCHCMTRGAIGIVLSHLSILQDAYDSGYEIIWVMEDDIQVIQNPHILSDLVELLDQSVGKEGWDILFTDRDTKNQNGEYVPCAAYAWRPNFTPPDPFIFQKRSQINGYFQRIGSRYGAYSMIIRRSGMEKMLNFIKKHKIFLPYDMEYYFPENMRLFSVLNDVVSTLPNALSDNGGPGYLSKQKAENP